MWNLKNNGTNELIYNTRNKVRDLENSLMIMGGKLGDWY